MSTNGCRGSATGNTGAGQFTDGYIWRNKWRRTAETSRTRRVRKAKGRPSSCEAPTGAKPEGRQREVRKWRRGWDSNPRWSCPHAAFRVRYFRPLSHLSASLVGAVSVRGRFHNLAARLAQGVSLPAAPQTGTEPAIWLDSCPRLTYLATRMRRGASCAVGLCLGNPQHRTSDRLHPAASAMDKADPFRLAKRRPAARREPDEHERTKDVRSH